MPKESARLEKFRKELLWVIKTEEGDSMVQAEISRARLHRISQKMTPEQRRASAINAVTARWAKVRADAAQAERVA